MTFLCLPIQNAFVSPVNLQVYINFLGTLWSTLLMKLSRHLEFLQSVAWKMESLWFKSPIFSSLKLSVLMGQMHKTSFQNEWQEVQVRWHGCTITGCSSSDSTHWLELNNWVLRIILLCFLPTREKKTFDEGLKTQQFVVEPDHFTYSAIWKCFLRRVLFYVVRIAWNMSILWVF